MKKTIFMACAMAMLAACSNNSNSSVEKNDNEKIEEVFMDYVKTDFGNPKDFVEITQFGEKDTINNAFIQENMVNTLDSLEWIMTTEQKAEFNLVKSNLAHDTIFVVLHPLKVRAKSGNGDVEVKQYYVIETKDGKFKVKEDKLDEEDMPDEIVRLWVLAKKLEYALREFYESLQ